MSHTYEKRGQLLLQFLPAFPLLQKFPLQCLDIEIARLFFRNQILETQSDCKQRDWTLPASVNPPMPAPLHQGRQYHSRDIISTATCHIATLNFVRELIGVVANQEQMKESGLVRLMCPLKRGRISKPKRILNE